MARPRLTPRGKWENPDARNRAIVGTIEVVATFHGDSFLSLSLRYASPL